MLEPLPPPQRTVATWEDVLSLVRARSTDLRLAFDEVEKAEGQSRIALAGALAQVNATGSLTHNFLQGTYPVAPGVNVPYPTRDVLAGQIGLVQPISRRARGTPSVPPTAARTPRGSRLRIASASSRPTSPARWWRRSPPSGSAS